MANYTNPFPFNNPLPTTGDITLEDIAEAFRLYLPYNNNTFAELSDYYGDKIKYYFPSARDGSTNLPLASSGKINISDFRGKRYGLPVPININSPVSRFNLFDAADSYAVSAYGLPIDTPNIPFFITLTNNSTITPAGAPSTPQQRSYTNPNATDGFTVVAGVTAISITATGAGGGGGGNDTCAGINGDPGYTVTGKLQVKANDVISVSVGGGGGPGGSSSRASGGAGGISTFGYSGGRGGPAGAHGYSGGGGGGGGATVIQRNGISVVVAGGGGGGGGGGNRSPGGPAPRPFALIGGIAGGNGGDAGGGKYDDGGGGGGGGAGASGGAGGGARANPPIRGGGLDGDRGGLTGATGSSTYPVGGTASPGSNGGGRGGGGGGNGSAVISYDILNLTASGPALNISTNSSGTRTFNDKSYIIIINNGRIVGEPAFATAGDAIYLRRQATISNNGSIIGGTVTGVPFTYGNAVNGYTYITNPPIGGTVTGGLVN